MVFIAHKGVNVFRAQVTNVHERTVRHNGVGNETKVTVLVEKLIRDRTKGSLSVYRTAKFFFVFPRTFWHNVLAAFSVRIVQKLKSSNSPVLSTLLLSGKIRNGNA
jgi:hypothetical protein